jgi:flagellar hook-basal body complex protein FliE
MNGAVSSVRILPAELDTPALRPAGESESGFQEVLRSAMDDMDQLQGEADAKVAGVLSGNGADVHSALIAVEKADLSFQLMMQVRNKIVSAYEEISRMQF